MVHNNHKFSPFEKEMIFNTVSPINPKPLAPAIFPGNYDTLVTGGHGARFEREGDKRWLIINVVPQKAALQDDCNKFRLTYKAHVDPMLYEIINGQCETKFGLPADCCGIHATFNVSITERGALLTWEALQSNMNELYPLVRVTTGSVLQKSQQSFTMNPDGSLKVTKTEVTTAQTNTIDFYVNGSQNALRLNPVAPTWNNVPINPEEFLGKKVIPFGLQLEQAETLIIYCTQQIEKLNIPKLDIDVSKVSEIYAQYRVRKSQTIVVSGIQVPKL